MSSKTKPLRAFVSSCEKKKEEAKPALAPTLRFPEFRGAEGWEPETIGEVCISFSGGTPSTAQKDYYGGNIPFIRSAEIDRTETELFLTDVGLKNSAAKLVEKGDVLIALYGANSGDVALGKIDGAINQAILCLQSESSNAFIYQFLSHSQNWIISTYLQGGQGNLSGDIVKSISLGFPTPAEQQKIAECLSSVDELMAAQARKVDALKTHKKGLMQQLFPREGETQPHLRFPEFQNAGGWGEEKLDDLLHFQDGFAFKSTDFVKAQEDATQVIRITDINNKNTNEDKVYIPTAFLETNKLAKYNVNDGDLLLSLTGAAGFNFFFWNGGPATINQRTAKVTSKKKSGLALLGLLEPLIHEKINERGEGQNNNLSKEFLSTIVLCVPGPAEQQRIATCLSSLDALITAETQKHEALKTHKKGLMQQLFPSPEQRTT